MFRLILEINLPCIRLFDLAIQNITKTEAIWRVKSKSLTCHLRGACLDDLLITVVNLSIHVEYASYNPRQAVHISTRLHRPEDRGGHHQPARKALQTYTSPRRREPGLNPQQWPDSVRGGLHKAFPAFYTETMNTAPIPTGNRQWLKYGNYYHRKAAWAP